MSDPRTLKLPIVTVYWKDRSPGYGPIVLHRCKSVKDAEDWIRDNVLDDELPDVYIDEEG